MIRTIWFATILVLAGCGADDEPIVVDENPPPLRCAIGDTQMTIHQTLMAGYDNPLRVVDSADFDGTNDYMTRGAGLTGAADSKSGTLSVWIRIDGGNGTGRRILSSSTVVGANVQPKIDIFIGTTNSITFNLRNSGLSVILSMGTGAYTSSSTWLHVLASWDLATLSRALYVNDVDVGIYSTTTDDTIDYTNADYAVGAYPDGDQKFNGCIAELYFAPGQYLDFSKVHNRRKFISASGKPVHLDATGSLPTGTAPIVYLHLDDGEAVANFATNRGTGGNFSITGTLDTGSTSPSD